MHTLPDERRHFTRIAFDAQTRISQGPLHWSVKLLDVSLKGMLIEKPLTWHPHTDPTPVFTAHIQLSGQTHIIMDMRLAHTEAHRLGFECTRIDQGSISHLRRVVELNLGDEALLQRELKALINEQ